MNDYRIEDILNSNQLYMDTFEEIVDELNKIYNEKQIYINNIGGMKLIIENKNLKEELKHRLFVDIDNERGL